MEKIRPSKEVTGEVKEPKNCCSVWCKSLKTRSI